MRSILASIAVVFWATASVAFDFPKLTNGDEEFYAAAAAGDPYAASDYVLPLTVMGGHDPEEFQNFIAWLRWMEDGFVAADHAYNAAWAADMAARHLVPRQELEAAAHRTQACYGYLSGAEDRDSQFLAASCARQLASIWVSLERAEEAMSAVQEARGRLMLLYNEEPTDELAGLIAWTMVEEGFALNVAKRFDEAVRAHQRAFEVYEQIEGADGHNATYAILNVGASYWYGGQFEAARDWTMRGLPLIDKYEGPFSAAAAATRINLGLIAYDLGDPLAAMDWVTEVLPFIASNPDESLDHQRWTFELLRRLLDEQGDVESAILFGKMAVNAQQEVRARNSGLREDATERLREEWSRLYEDLATLLIAEGRFSEAQAVQNMYKEQETFEFLKRDASLVLNETRAVLTNAELSDADKLTTLAAQPVAAYEVYRALEASFGDRDLTEAEEDQLFLLEDAMWEARTIFRDEVAAFLETAAESEREGFADLFDATGSYQDILMEKQALGHEAAILQLAVHDDATHLFLTLPGATEYAEVAMSKGDMRAMVFEALQALERVDPDVDVHMKRLHDALFAPIQPYLEIAGTEIVMLNAGDVLRYIPFAALHDGEDYLVRDFAFAQYVAAVPTDFERADRAPDSAVGFGVTQAHGAFSALPGVELEISTLFDMGDGQGVLSGATALDADFDTRALQRSLRREPELLHIASHFALVPGQVDDSFLLMGDGSHLPLSEIADRFRFTGVDLLTLSACQTARGGDGSEIDGVAAAALKSGASAVMASLWPVADAATPILMQDFYEGLYGDGLDKAAALQRAQIAMLEGEGEATVMAMRAAAAIDDNEVPPQGFAHPYFWSAFILMGNWL
ncbi:MAG: CHAT domain-containing protein [Pseudomonadota bacterium]